MAEPAFAREPDSGLEHAAEERELDVDGDVVPKQILVDAALENASDGLGEGAFRGVGVGLHTLAHEHGVAVADGEHGAHGPSDRLLDADRFEAGVGETARELVERLRGERGEQRLAAGVVAVEGGAADAGSAGEVGHARVAVLGEQASRRLEDRGRRAEAIAEVLCRRYETQCIRSGTRLCESPPRVRVSHHEDTCRPHPGGLTRTGSFVGPPTPAYGTEKESEIASTQPQPRTASPDLTSPELQTLDRETRPARVTAAPVVTAHDLTRQYGSGETTVNALSGVSVEVASGQLTAVMGPSGSGKSTLMHILAGLDKPTSGEVYVAGTAIGTLKDTQLTKLRREHIGFIFQFFNLLPMLTAKENIVLPLSIAGVKPDPEWLEELTTAVGLTERLSHRPSELSGGQQQRVAIARALVSKPTVMFADEPTGNLDSRTSSEILALLRDSVSSYGQTTVMVTHDAHAAAIADRILFLADGLIVKDLGPSTSQEILETLQEVTSR